MIKRLILCLCGISLSLQLVAQANDTAYIYTYGGIQDDACSQAQPTADGGYILIGTTNSFGSGNTAFYAIKTDSVCKVQWTNTYGGPLNEAGYSVVQTLDKGYAFLGYTDSYGNGGYDVYLVKTDSLGKVKWTKTYGGTDWDFGYSIKQTKDSGYVICGLTYSYGAGNGDVYIVRTDKNGDTLWTRTVGGTGYDVGNCVSVHEDSIYAIAALTTSNGRGDTDSYFIEMNDKGTVEHTRTYGIFKNDGVNSIQGTADKGFIMFGYTDSIPGSNSTHVGELVLKVDSVGKFQWLQDYNLLTSMRTGRDAMETSNGGFLTVGTSLGDGSGGYSMHILRLAPGGWYQAGPAFGGTKDESGNSIAYHNKNNLVFAGATNSYGAGLMDFYVVRFPSDSIVANYILSIHNFKDTLSPAGLVDVVSDKAGARIFPNPMATRSTVLVQGQPGERYWLSLYDESGKCISGEMYLNPSKHGQSVGVINRDNMTSSIYLYKIRNNTNDVVATGKLIIE